MNGRRLLHRHHLRYGRVLIADREDGVRPVAGLRPAVPGDLAAVLTLLVDAGLPTAGVAEAFAGFVVAEREGRVVAAGGLEVAGNHALFRSLVVRDAERGTGVGALVTARLLAAARERRFDGVWLLTESAAPFFERFGFHQIDRATAPPEVQATGQFGRDCGSCAVAMFRRAQPLRVLVLCTANSARSQIAEALLQHMGGDRVHAASAGTNPGAGPHPLAIAALAARGILWEGKRSKSIDEVDLDPELVITVCDAAREACPVLPGHAMLHWGLPDPAVVSGSEEQRLAAFEETVAELERRIGALLAA